MRRSLGHMFFTDSQEFYERDGEVYRAPLHNAIAVDGHRYGRWECSRAHWDKWESPDRWGRKETS